MTTKNYKILLHCYFIYKYHLNFLFYSESVSFVCLLCHDQLIFIIKFNYRSCIYAHLNSILDYIIHMSLSGRPMVISTGMQSMETIRRVYKTVKEHKQNFTLLQCTSAYPLDPKEVNLSVIKVILVNNFLILSHHVL